ncbi:hypothetical protein, partial [Nocardia abscessus]|uniref:hypothetical protein n=1 Tax=Nocardia abscessus TaxID=120957 RepID=UPI0024547B57
HLTSAPGFERSETEHAPLGAPGGGGGRAGGARRPAPPAPPRPPPPPPPPPPRAPPTAHARSRFARNRELR